MILTRRSSLAPLVLLYGMAFLLLLLAGVFIGFFRSYDAYVALMLCFVTLTILVFAYLYMGRSKQFVIFASGMILAGIFGIVVEVWGTVNGYWQYHDLADGRHLPYWLPFAWALAFAFLYVVERLTIRFLPIKTSQAKLALAVVLAAILPAWGEMAAINSGVWTYSWPLQILGVPLLAIFLLVIFHMGVNTLLSTICRRYDIDDPVFNESNEALMDGRVRPML